MEFLRGGRVAGVLRVRVAELGGSGVVVVKGGVYVWMFGGENASPPRRITAPLLLLLRVFYAWKFPLIPQFSHAVRGGEGPGGG